jgi:hypothetical protein
MLCLVCGVKYSIFEPIPEHRRSCPYMLVISKGVHPHPIPFPDKTPPIFRSEIFRLLETIRDDLPDLTSRRFLRHPVLKAYLSSHFPDIPNPTISDLHVSLANRAHLRAYIDQAKHKHFPMGTGWEGMSCTSSVENLDVAAMLKSVSQVQNISRNKRNSLNQMINISAESLRFLKALMINIRKMKSSHLKTAMLFVLSYA